MVILTTEIGNEIIAEFNGDTYKDGLIKLKDSDAWFGKLYDQDWNLLIKVVEKIENLWISGEKTKIQINGNYVQMSHCVGYQNIDYASNVSGDNKINAVWLAIVEFIEWYNKQSK